MAHHAPEFTANTDRIVTEALIDSASSKEFFKNYVEEVPFAKANSTDSYHITIGFMHRIEKSKSKSLYDHIHDFIRNHELQYMLTGLKAILGQAGRFPGNNTIVIFIKNKMDFLKIQKDIRSCIKQFQSFNSYDFNYNTQPANYTPHLSIGWGDQNAIEALNRKLDLTTVSLSLSIKDIRARIASTFSNLPIPLW